MFLILLLSLVGSIILSAMSLSLRSLSLPYLRYWARKGDQVSKKIYPLKARGSAVYLTIELFRSIFIVGVLVTMTSLFGELLTWIIGTAILFTVFVVLNDLYLRSMGTWLLANLSDQILKLSFLLKVITTPLGNALDKFVSETPTTLTRKELTQMIYSVQSADTDLSSDELRILKHSLSFGSKSVHDVMTPRSVINAVQADDIISPILLDELHKSGHSRFPVFDTKKETVLGILYIKDLVDVRHKLSVSELMHKPAQYVNQERELDHVLQAFIRTKQHLFIVVNEFAEITGLITIEDIVEQVLGKPIIDEFDKYDSMRDVAEARAKITKKQLKTVD